MTSADVTSFNKNLQNNNNRETAPDALNVLYIEDVLGRDEYASYSHHLLDTFCSSPEFLAYLHPIAMFS